MKLLPLVTALFVAIVGLSSCDDPNAPSSAQSTQAKDQPSVPARESSAPACAPERTDERPSAEALSQIKLPDPELKLILVIDQAQDLAAILNNKTGATKDFQHGLNDLPHDQNAPYCFFWSTEEISFCPGQRIELSFSKTGGGPISADSTSPRFVLNCWTAMFEQKPSMTAYELNDVLGSYAHIELR